MDDPHLTIDNDKDLTYEMMRLKLLYSEDELLKIFILFASTHESFIDKSSHPT